MKIKFWNPSKQYLAHKHEFDSEMQRVLTAGDLILRDDVKKFEDNLAKYLNVKHVVSVASGTDALMLSLKAAGIGVGDNVITTGHTFRATVEAIHHTGAGIGVADYGQDWRDFDTSFVKAIIPVHIAGEIHPWTFDASPPVIEDSCQAIGAKPLTGLAACYSFYPAKILGCFGDGGAVATNDEEFAVKIRKLRNHYKDDWSEYGYNSRLDNLQAAVLNVKLKYLPDVIKRRKEIAMKYDDALMPLTGIDIGTIRDIYQDYIVKLEGVQQRDKLHAYFASQGIETIKNQYPFPNDTPKPVKARQYESQTLRIPCNETLTDKEVKYIIKIITEYDKR